jgi:hypothetical protein
MELWVQEGARNEDVDSIEAVEKSVEAKDDLVENAICEAPHRSCQVRGHIREEGTWRCCQPRACVERDHYQPRAMSERLAEEALEWLRDAERRREVPMMSEVIRVNWSRTR